MEELILRLTRITGRRTAGEKTGHENAEGPVKMGDFIFDPISEAMLYKGTEVKLAYREMELLYLLCRHGNTLVDRNICSSRYGAWIVPIIQRVWMFKLPGLGRFYTVTKELKS